MPSVIALKVNDSFSGVATATSLQFRPWSAEAYSMSCLISCRRAGSMRIGMVMVRWLIGHVSEGGAAWEKPETRNKKQETRIEPHTVRLFELIMAVSCPLVLVSYFLFCSGLF